MKKYFYSIILILCVVLSLTACNTKRKNVITDSSESAETANQETELNVEISENEPETSGSSYVDSQIGFSGEVLEESEDNEETGSSGEKKDQFGKNEVVVGNTSESVEATPGSTEDTSGADSEEDNTGNKNDTYEGDLLEPVKNGSDGVL